MYPVVGEFHSNYISSMTCQFFVTKKLRRIDFFIVSETVNSIETIGRNELVGQCEEEAEG